MQNDIRLKVIIFSFKEYLKSKSQRIPKPTDTKARGYR
jgi:hypothetical protein